LILEVALAIVVARARLRQFFFLRKTDLQIEGFRRVVDKLFQLLRGFFVRVTLLDCEID